MGMTSLRLRQLARLIVALCGAAVLPVHADGECGKGYVDTGAAERAVMTHVMETALRALPAAPDGWVIPGDDRISIPQSLCQDYADHPWGYAHTRYYQRVAGQAERDAALQHAADVAQTELAQKQPQIDALMARMNELTQQSVAAMQQGDYARAEALGAEVQKVGDEYTQLLDSGEANAVMQATSRTISRDMTMSIDLRANSRRETLPENSHPATPPAGAYAAYEWQTETGDVQESHELVLFGHWHTVAPGMQEPEQRPGASMAQAHVFSVEVMADKSRMADAVNAIDFASIAALLH